MDHRQALAAEITQLRKLAGAITRNPDKADDLVQDTLERALRKGEQLRPEVDLRLWLRRVMRNLYIDDHRRAVRRGRAVELPDELLSCPPRQEQQILLREVARAIRGFEARGLLLGSALQMTYREMAAQAKVPIGTVRSRLSRARRQLSRIVEGEEPGGASHRREPAGSGGV